MFQSTRPRGARRSARSGFRRSAHRFNPRAREGRDVQRYSRNFGLPVLYTRSGDMQAKSIILITITYHSDNNDLRHNL